jgi:hypothetical protein
LPKKQQGFWIRKISSDRLSKNHYKLNLPLEEARSNSEIVTFSDCQVLRSLRKLKNKPFISEEFSELIQKRKKLKHLKDSPENRKLLQEIEQKIQDALYVPEIVNILFVDKRHYEKVIKTGLWIDGFRYKRLLASAGMMRRNVVQFIREDYEKPLKEILNCGRNLNSKLVPNKFSSYFGLYSSSTQEVSTPKFVVIPDYEYTKLVTVDYMTDKVVNGDYQMEERTIPQTINVFDGQGIISPDQSFFWAAELDISWIPATWIFRMPFGKGQLVTFDFHKFAREAGKFKVVDVWGQEHNIFDVEVLVSASQFKLATSYESCDHYLENCKKNQLNWGVSRYSPEKTKTHSFSTYQFLQNLNISSDDQIKSLCKDTVEWIEKVSGGDYKYSVLFMLGELAQSDIDENIFSSISDPVLKSLLYELDLINNAYIKNYIFHMINKKVRESYMGVLLLNGSNYQPMIGDCVAQIEHALGMEVKGVLSSGENYSNYWNKKNVKKISTLRAPMIWHSENNVIDLKDDSITREYFKNVYDGIIFNIYDDSLAKMSGADLDGDICQSTDQKEFIDCAYNEKMISYDRKMAVKKEIVEEDLWQYDIPSFNSRIGFVTNVSSYYHTLLPLFDPLSDEYKAIINRLKLIFCWQSMEIDKTKGIETLPFPKHWTRWTKIKEDFSEDEKKEAEFNNKLIADKHPYFFRWLYPEKNYKYTKHQKTYENYCYSKFGFGIDDLLSKTEKNEKEKIASNYYLRFSPLLNSDCMMNKISHYMQSKIKEIKIKNRKSSFEQFWEFSDFNPEKLLKVKKLFLKYRSFKKDRYDQNFLGLSLFISGLKKEAIEITSDSYELVSMALSIDTKFGFSVFGEEIVNHLAAKKGGVMIVPVQDDNGDVSYLGKKYKFMERSDSMYG